MRYQPYYCEENAWHRVADPVLAASGAKVLVISNAEKAVPFWQQRAAPRPDDVVMWDYHVVVWALGQIWDPDHVPGCPVPVASWLSASFAGLAAAPEPYWPRFRCIDGAYYRAHFASDRRHMRTAEGWQAPPPSWPPIGDGHVLPELLDLSDAGAWGPWLSLDAFAARAGLARSA